MIMNEKIVNAIGCMILIAIFGGIALAFFFIISSNFETHREIVAVCNSDHLAENMTQYCLDHQALNTTLWEMHHKQ